MNTKHTMNRITLSLLVAAIITTPITTTAGVMDAIRRRVTVSSEKMAENLTPKPSSVTEEFAAKVTEIAENQGDTAAETILNEVLGKSEYVEITPELETAIQKSANTTHEESLLQNNGEVVVTKTEAVKDWLWWMYNASTTGLSKAGQSTKGAIKAHPYIAGAAVISIVGGFVCYKYHGKIVAAVKLAPAAFGNMLRWLKANPVKSTLATTGLVGLGAAYKFGLFGKAAAYASPFASKGLELGSKLVAQAAPYFTKQAAQQGLTNIMAQATLKNAGWVGLGLGAFATGRYLRKAFDFDFEIRTDVDLTASTQITNEVQPPVHKPVETESVIQKEPTEDTVSPQEQTDQEARNEQRAQELQEQEKEARTKEEQRLAREKEARTKEEQRLAREKAKAKQAIVDAAEQTSTAAAELAKLAVGVELTQEQTSALKTYIKALNANPSTTKTYKNITEVSKMPHDRSCNTVNSAYNNLVKAFSK